MSDKPPLRTEDFVAFFLEKQSSGGPFICQVCGNGSFAPCLAGTTMQSGMAEIVSSIAHPAGPTPLGSHNFYAVSCTNCGNSNFFHVKPVMDWLSERGRR